MADVAVTVQEITRTGIDLTDTGSLSVSDTYLVPNDGKTILHIKKSGATDCTVTIATPNTVDGLAVGDLTVTVPATTGDKHIGPFPREIYNNADGKIAVTFSNITGLTMAAARI
ncbi:MAG: hypothetical protein KGZ65_00080 [Sphingomonadales bacterium]|nr:hypothetical protein [Sphingomonadaceae bacterium]MBS3929603.1 hypothetical protein [Sphingomonadales bacterium]